MRNSILTFLICLILSSLALAQQNNSPKEAFGCCKQHLFNKQNQKLLNKRFPNPKMYDYDIKFTFLDLNVTNTSTALDGTVTYKAQVISETLDQFIIEAITALNITQITVNNQPCNVEREGDNIIATINNPLQKNDIFTAVVTYNRPEDAPVGGFFSGISNGYGNKKATDSKVPDYNRVTWTLSEPLAAKQWFPCKQDLTDKSDSVYVYLTCDENLMVGSQGLLKEVEQLANNKKKFKWESKYPIAYYLISFAISNYQEYTNYAKPAAMEGDSIMIQHYIYNGSAYLESNKAKLDATTGLVELFSDLYSLYPFHEEKYGHTTAPLGGAMEHQTMSTMGYLNFGINAHELSHQWFGDNVTCQSWSHIWVNEGFASYSEYLALENVYGLVSAGDWLNQAQTYASYDIKNSVYVPEDEVYEGNEGRIFSSILTYKKGACILHMLRHEINNDETFYEIFKTYQNQFANSTATADDFFEVAKNVSGTDWEIFKNQWFYGKAFPAYDVEWNYKNGQLSIQSTQTTFNEETPFFEMTNEYQLTFADGSTELIRLKQTQNIQEHIVDLEKEVYHIQMNPNHQNLCKVNKVSVGINESPIEELFSISPNPAKGYCNIQLMQSVNQGQIHVFNTAGVCVLSEGIQGNQHQLNTAKLDKGVYFIQVQGNSFQHIEKLIKE